ncbi:MAG: hypothetical protein ACI9JM_003271 [Halioglobus sp.]|jgi:hypothetical protein
MTTAQAIEYRITRHLLQRDSKGEPEPDITGWADRLIAVLAVTVGIFVLGTYLEELLWVLIAGVTVFALGSRSD